MPQSWDPALYEKIGHYVPELGLPVVELLAPQPGERILDLGCGSGTLTQKLVESGASVLGIDASAQMIRGAKKAGLNAVLMDAHKMTFTSEFDAVFSNAALHWMTNNPEAVVKNVYKALKPGGRFVAEMGGEGNIAIIRHCMKEALRPYHQNLDKIYPKFFPSQAQYQGMLEAAGFTVETITLFPRPTRLDETGLEGWLKVFARGMLSELPAGAMDKYITRVVRKAHDQLHDENGWWADYVRLRFAARKPA